MDELHRSTLVQQSSDADLPQELVHAVNQTYFLHLLATEPAKVLPPGKSLISVVTQEKLGQTERGHGDLDKHPNATVERQVNQVMQNAVWDVTAKNLASPEPSEQNLQIKQLLNDIHDAISPLLPPQESLLRTLSLPPPPSIAPLYSFVVILKEVLSALRGRCAIVRDGEIDIELEKLESVPPKVTPGSSTSSHNQRPDGSISPLATVVTHSVKAIMVTIDHMKSDLQDFLLASMTEEQLRGLVTREAKLRERDIVIKIWSRQGQDMGQRGEDTIREEWRLWCAQTQELNLVSEGDKWKLRLVQALAATKAISCIPPGVANTHTTSSPEDNRLPPQFFFSATSLYKLQDYLQAVVIAATLRSLTRLPSPLPPTSPIQTSAQDFMQRVWVLLKTDLDVPTDHGSSTDNPLKLINLEDEVVRACWLVMEVLDSAEEQKLREAVRRTLQPSDPVFLLLRKRLVDALLKNIVAGSSSREGVGIPDVLKAGRSFPRSSATGKRLKLMFSDEGLRGTPNVTSRSTVISMPVIKGFEDPVLLTAIDETLSNLAKIVGWTESVWGDLV